MSSILTALTSLSSYHLFSWGSLFGTQLYQTFVMTKLCYLHLPRAQFMTLQKRVFPAYFTTETVLTLATALTYPTGSISALSSNPTDLALLGVTLVTSGLNLFVYGPKTTEALMKRNHAETRDGLQLGTSSEMGKDKVSKEMYQAKRMFSRNHAMSIHLNLISVIATFLYGVSLSSRIMP